MSGKIFGLATRKGGVGKTTSTGTIAVEYAIQEKEEQEQRAKPERKAEMTEEMQEEQNSVLAIEMDTQRNLSTGLGVDLETWRLARLQRIKETGEDLPELHSIYEALLNPEYGVGYATYATKFGIDILPSVAAMSGVEKDLSDAVARESRLRMSLRTAEEVSVQAVDRWKTGIFIDTPPALGLLTMNVLAAADYILIPVQIGEYALDAVPEVFAAVDLIKRINKKIKIAGIFLTMYDSRTRLSDNIVREARNRYGELVFNTMIPLNTRLAEVPSLRQPIQIYDPTCSSARAYTELVKEIKQRCS